ncbi:MAG: hypothetical protein NVSMB7_08960 [Chitinophagaceae bacterium]
MVTITGILFWSVSVAAIHQVKLFVEHTDTTILHNTLKVFFILNIAFSCIQLLAIFLDTGFRNPFLYQGQYQKYFINTGDYIRGISFDTSTTNALVSCFGIVYFLYRRNFLLVIASMIILLITASNFSNIILMLFFLVFFTGKSTREQKSIMAACMVLLVVFFSKISPQNEKYVSDTIGKFILRKNKNIIAPEKAIPIREKPDSLLTPEGRKERTAVLFLDSLERTRVIQPAIDGNPPVIIHFKKPEIPKDNIHTASFQWKRDTTVYQQQLLSFMQQRASGFFNKYPTGIPGKILAFKESIHYLKDHPSRIISGNGTGNFSSKLAFRATGLQMAGRFPPQFRYCHPGFLNNHLALYAYFFSKHADSHSIIHNPGSVYDQLLAEYGLLGIIAFPVFYIGFFLRHLKKLTYGLPLLVMLLAFFMVDYWFEQLSIAVLFELMMFINIKEYTPGITNE